MQRHISDAPILDARHPRRGLSGIGTVAAARSPCVSTSGVAPVPSPRVSRIASGPQGHVVGVDRDAQHIDWASARVSNLPWLRFEVGGHPELPFQAEFSMSSPWPALFSGSLEIQLRRRLGSVGSCRWSGWPARRPRLQSRWAPMDAVTAARAAGFRRAFPRVARGERLGTPTVLPVVAVLSGGAGLASPRLAEPADAVIRRGDPEFAVMSQSGLA